MMYLALYASKSRLQLVDVVGCISDILGSYADPWSDERFFGPNIHPLKASVLGPEYDGYTVSWADGDGADLLMSCLAPDR